MTTILSNANEAIQKRIETITQYETAEAHLDTQQVSFDLYVYWADETRSLWTVTYAELLTLGRYLMAGMPDAYSEWCSLHGREATRLETKAYYGEVRGADPHRID